MKARGLFITGTDTGVGKTYVTSMIARELAARGVRVGAYKPACTGSIAKENGEPLWPDVEALSRAIGGDFDSERICPQRFTAAAAPPVAARLEGKSVDARLLRSAAEWWTDKVEMLLIEGVGGLLCPLTETETVADLAVELGYPLLVVSRLGLGTINHTSMTVEAAQHRGLTIAGIVLNQVLSDASDAASRTNPAEIAARCKAPLLGVVAHSRSDGLLRNGDLIQTDWLALAAHKSGFKTGTWNVKSGT